MTWGCYFCSSIYIYTVYTHHQSNSLLSCEQTTLVAWSTSVCSWCLWQFLWQFTSRVRCWPMLTQLLLWSFGDDHYWLVVQFHHLEKWWTSSMGLGWHPIYSPYMKWKIIQPCSKPPTRLLQTIASWSKSPAQATHCFMDLHGLQCHTCQVDQKENGKRDQEWRLYKMWNPTQCGHAMENHLQTKTVYIEIIFVNGPYSIALWNVQIHYAYYSFTIIAYYCPRVK